VKICERKKRLTEITSPFINIKDNIKLKEVSGVQHWRGRERKIPGTKKLKYEWSRR